MRKLFACFFLVAFFGCIVSASAASRPNILLITVDDMSCDSIGMFGCKLPGTTPNIDRLAAESLRFEYAHVHSGSCMPSRNAMFSGRASHNNKVEGFYHVRQPGYPVLSDLMREGGYFAGIRGKVSHSTPYHPYKWDLVMEDDGVNVASRKNVASYGRSTREGIEAAQAAKKPFYLNINVSDPHKPFYAEGPGGKTVPDTNVPSRVFTPEEVPVPGFLPDDAVVRKELAHYYSSVRRADDCVAAVLKELKDSGLADKTIVIFLSDHGMPLLFAKTQVYHHSTRTPLIIRWPGVTKAGGVDREHMVSGLDILPTFLEMAGIDQPKDLDGRSFVPLLRGKKQKGRTMIFKEHNENSGGHRNPMRAVQTKTHLYIFSPWANGTRKMGTATAGTSTYGRMQQLAKTDPKVAARLKLADYRVLEEFYDVAKDPDNLQNLIEDPASQKEMNRLRAALGDWMKTTRDPLFPVFEKRHDVAFRENYIKQLEKESEQRLQDRASRAKRGNWKKAVDE